MVWIMGRTSHTAQYHKNDSRKLSDRKITILENTDFEFWESELNIIAQMFTGYHDIQPIAKRLSRKNPDEILLAFVHLAKETKLKQLKKLRGK